MSKHEYVLRLLGALDENATMTYDVDAQKVISSIVFCDPMYNPLTLSLKTLDDMVVLHILSTPQSIIVS